MKRWHWFLLTGLLPALGWILLPVLGEEGDGTFLRSHTNHIWGPLPLLSMADVKDSFHAGTPVTSVFLSKEVLAHDLVLRALGGLYVILQLLFGAAIARMPAHRLEFMHYWRRLPLLVVPAALLVGAGILCLQNWWMPGFRGSGGGLVALCLGCPPVMIVASVYLDSGAILLALWGWAWCLVVVGTSLAPREIGAGKDERQAV